LNYPIILQVALSTVLISPTFLAADSPAPSAPESRPAIGAIRWDAWYGKDTGTDPELPVRQVERSLGPKKFHFRLPFFAKVLSASKVSINGDSQDVIEKEISYAADAGLDYWAFVDYWDDPTLSIALQRYQAAQNKKGIRFCLIEEGNRLDSIGSKGWPRLIALFKNSDYQMVLSGRPLLFVLGRPKLLDKAAFADLSNAAVAAGLKRPYIVMMDFNVEAAAKTIRELGFDAVSAYAQCSEKMVSYEELTGWVRTRYWEKHRQLGIPTITFATAGWDTRPRREHPVSWIPGIKATPDATSPDGQKPLMDAVTATPAQLARHVQDALDWTRQNRNLNPANAIILYAWNENDEGGWIIPTRNPDGSPNTERVQALRSVLRPR